MSSDADPDMKVTEEVKRYKKRCEWILITLSLLLWLVITVGSFAYPRADDFNDTQFELLQTSTEVVWYTIIVLLFSVALVKIMLQLR